MTKKVFLALGISTLAILPIAAISSCSTTRSKKSMLETEASKFEKTFEVKSTAKVMSAFEVASMINSENANEAKLETLAKLVDLPELKKEFNYEIKSAEVDKNNLMALNVLFNITEINTPTNNKELMLVAEGLAVSEDQQLLIDKAKLLIDKETITGKDKETAKSAANIIRSNGTLATYYKEIDLGPVVNYSWKSSEAFDNNKVKVVVVVWSGVVGTTPIEKTIIISGFKTIEPITQEEMAAQADRLIDQQVLPNKAHQTSFLASSLLFNDANTTIDDYYPKITLEKGLTYRAHNTVDNDDTLIVLLRVTSEAPNVRDELRPVNIRGFATPLQSEAHQFRDPIMANEKAKTIKTNVVIDKINNASTQRLKLRAINRYISTSLFPDSNFNWTIGDATLDPTTPTSVNVAITIREISTGKILDVKMIIAGLVEATQ